ncbi:hypothetical protein BKI52_32110 [marine bacterium AO1-C]|nr:hypothetical protein BKI52_32110 [marine bacterium AO1-C]
MKIIKFDIQQGIYHFETEYLDTELHAHPAVEIVMAEKGTFDLKTPFFEESALRFAIIDAHTLHQVTADACCIKLLMLESCNTLFNNRLNQLGIAFTHGVFTAHTSSEIFQQLETFGNNHSLWLTTDERVNNCLQIFRENDLEYQEMIESLKAITFLSESRLSHLFKEHVGISLKKYLVWTKLKKTIAYLLQEEANLTQSSLQGGFYDQAHFTKAFKNLLGISPSKAYNSRTLQFLFPSV